MKIFCLSVKEILDEEVAVQAAAKECIEDTKTLSDYIKLLCSEKAFTIRSLVKFLRKDNREFIKKHSRSQLKSMVKEIIIKSPGGGYSSKELHEGWKEKRYWFWLFYYFHPEHLEKETQEKVLNKTW